MKCQKRYVRVALLSLVFILVTTSAWLANVDMPLIGAANFDPQPAAAPPDTPMPPLQRLIEAKDSASTRLEEVLKDPTLRGLRWWSPGQRRFLCLAVEDPDLKYDSSGLGQPSLLRFYEEAEHGLRLRYVYHCDRELIAFSHFPTSRRKPDTIDENLLVILYPHKGITFVAFGLRENNLCCIWDSGSTLYHIWPEFADIDGDDVQEVVLWEPNDKFDPNQHANATAFIYRELGGEYQLVERTRYADRLQLRRLPTVPLSE